MRTRRRENAKEGEKKNSFVSSFALSRLRVRIWNRRNCLISAACGFAYQAAGFAKPQAAEIEIGHPHLDCESEPAAAGKTLPVSN